jgi:hypothetical protein
MTDGTYIRLYEGASWAQAYDCFRSDAALAAFDGWQPISSSWADDGLRVVYGRREADRGESLWRTVAKGAARRSPRLLAVIWPWLLAGTVVVALTVLVIGPVVHHLTS